MTGTSFYGSTIGRLRAVTAATVIATAVFVVFPGIDLAVARMLVGSDGHFILAFDPFAHFINSVVPALATLIGVFALTGLVVVAVKRVPFYFLKGRDLVFLVLVLSIGPGLIANSLFKENWGRARPSQIEAFGGDKVFSKAFVISDQCPGNCSFISGDASLAFALLALVVVWPGNRRRAAVAIGAFGVLVGFVRMAQGAHFLSDVVLAALIMMITILLLQAVVLERRWGVSAFFEKIAGKPSSSRPLDR